MNCNYIASELLQAAKEMTGIRVAKRLDLGRVVTTRSVSVDMRKNPEFAVFVSKSLRRHQRGDWGDVKGQDRRMNDQAFKSGEDRVFSVYEGGPEGKIWIITEWDRSVTTVLYPSDY